MKKNFLIVGMIVVFSMNAFLTSCTRTLQCACSTTDQGVSQSTFEKDLNKALKDVGWDGNCNDVESKLIHSYGYKSVSCY